VAVSSGAGAASSARRRTAFARRPVDRAVSRDSHQPAGRRSEPGVVGFSAVPDLKEDLLQDFLGLAAISQNTKDQSEQQAVVPIIQFTHRPFVARDNAFEEGDVGGNFRSDGFAQLVPRRHVSTRPTFEARPRSCSRPVDWPARVPARMAGAYPDT
jgi:hypothetical protein